jgi:uncharacterized phage protein gp47/JayE
MATFLTPTQVFQAFQTYLKSIKPSLNVNDMNSDFIIRGKTVSGLISGLYGDQAKTYLDTFISTCRPAALVLFSQDFNIPQQPAVQAASVGVQIPGSTNGTVVNPGDLTFLYGPTNVIYTNTTGGIVSGGILTVNVQCEITGQIGNISFPDSLQVISPPTGIGATANLAVDMSDGSDIETIDSWRARILSFVQSPPAGGNSIDYPNFAFLASQTVRSASIVRWGRGLGTVDVYITTGTTDIDTAITQGQSIVRIPSDDVIATIQAYYDIHDPLTDSARVYAPSEQTFDVTVKVDLVAGLTLTSVPDDATYNPLGLTVSQLVQRELSRVIYKLPTGGRKVPGLTGGFVVAADLEVGLDTWLSAVPDSNGVVSGKLPLLTNRQVQMLASPSWDAPVGGSQLPKPGTLTVNTGV